MEKKKSFNFWVIASLVVLALYLLFMVYPLVKLVSRSVVDADSGGFSMRYFKQFFSTPYYSGTMINSFKVAIAVSVTSTLIGIPLAYLYNMYKVRGRKALQMLIILSSMSAPFLGAYAWIMLLGRSGVITKFFEAAFGVTIPSIYGFKGIVLALTMKMYPMVFLYVSGALKTMDNSLMEASANMGCDGLKRVFKVVLPLCMPSILAAVLMVFMRSMADFGTPLMIGEGYSTFPVLIYNSYVGEVGTNQNFAAAISVIAILLTMMFFLLQKAVSSRYRFSMSTMRHNIEKKQARLLPSMLIHIFSYGVVAVSLLPQAYLVYLSFRKTGVGGVVFMPGYSLESYQEVFRKMGNVIWNTLRICGTSLVLIIVLAILIAYLVVRRRNAVNGIIDALSMVPYVIPGSVVGIALIISFNNRYIPLVGTAAIMVVSMCIRRIPYTIRSSVAILGQIPITIDEAAESLGAGRIKTLCTITVPMMLSGIFSGAIMSWVTLITELSSSILLYSYKTQTLNVAIYSAVSKGTDGRACALSTILMIFTVVSLLLFNKFSKDGEIMM